MKLFILLVLLVLAFNVYRSFEISSLVNVEEIIENRKQTDEENPCPAGQQARYGYGEAGWEFKNCYTPAKDAGKECLQAGDCTSSLCKVAEENDVYRNCEFKLESQSYICPEISGNCGDGGSIESGFYIGRKNHVFRKTYY